MRARIASPRENVEFAPRVSRIVVIIASGQRARRRRRRLGEGGSIPRDDATNDKINPLKPPSSPPRFVSIQWDDDANDHHRDDYHHNDKDGRWAVRRRSFRLGGGRGPLTTRAREFLV